MNPLHEQINLRCALAAADGKRDVGRALNQLYDRINIEMGWIRRSLGAKKGWQTRKTNGLEMARTERKGTV